MLHYLSRVLDLVFFGRWAREPYELEISPQTAQHFFVWVDSPNGNRFLVQLTKI